MLILWGTQVRYYHSHVTGEETNIQKVTCLMVQECGHSKKETRKYIAQSKLKVLSCCVSMYLYPVAAGKGSDEQMSFRFLNQRKIWQKTF